MSVTDGRKATESPEPRTDEPTVVAYTDTAARNGSDLANGHYDIIAETLCYYLQGGSTVDATLDVSHRLPAETYRRITVTGSANARVSFVRDTASGNAFIDGPL